VAQIALTLRIGPAEHAALKHLSRIEGRPINKLLNEAVKIYLAQRGKREQGLEASLAGLKAYRRRDAGFRRAIAALVESEAAGRDPLEGKPLRNQR
jgi:hypothetical protein